LVTASREAKASDRAYRRLRQLIVSLKLEPGQAIDEKSLSLELGIGRTPVREALLKLAGQRLVDIMPRRGTFVAPLRFDELRSVEDLRWHLECLSTRWAAQRILPQELVGLRRLIDEAEDGAFARLDDWDVEVDRRFHQLLASAAKNSFLEESLDHLYDHSVRLLYATRQGMTAAAEELPDYRRIIDAIASGDVEAAVEGMQCHLRASRAQVASGFEAHLNAAAS
jgi:DNA-binding GntR family transcriptional regulator